MKQMDEPKVRHGVLVCYEGPDEAVAKIEDMLMAMAEDATQIQGNIWLVLAEERFHLFGEALEKSIYPHDCKLLVIPLQQPYPYQGRTGSPRLATLLRRLQPSHA